MKTFTESQLQTAVERASLDPGVFESLRRELLSEPETAAAFEPAHIAYYLGALLIIGAMGWFITNAWESLSGITIFAVALAYAVAFGAAGVLLYRRPATLIPGGLLATVAV